MTDQELVNAMRRHPGGIGRFMTDDEKDRLFSGPKNHPENTRPVNTEELARASEEAFRLMPPELMLGEE